MQKLCVLTATSLLFFGLSSAAVGAPIAVEYAFGGGTASYIPAANGTIASGVAGAGMTVVYTSGSTVIGGTLGANGQMGILAVSFTSPGTLFGTPIPAMGVGVNLAGTRTAGGSGNFVGATSIPISYFGPGLPPLPFAGTANINFASIGGGFISLNAFGVQSIPAIGLPINWTVTGVVGQEISRTAVPEPGTGALLLGSLAGLAFGARRLRR